MKSFVSFLCLVGLVVISQAQNSRTDSLTGFNTGQLILNLRLRNFSNEDIKYTVRQNENAFIRTKFNLQDPTPLIVTKSGVGNAIANAPCVDEGFEGLPLSPLASSGWTAYTGSNPLGTQCTSGTFIPSTAGTSVMVTPITDANCNNVSASPLGGSNVLRLNSSSGPINARVLQTFSVTASNFIYQYAYKGFSNGIGHNCCDAPSFLFNFYDCSGNLISAMSQTIVPNLLPCGFPASWVITPTSGYTPNWVIVGENLVSYIGSCVTVEIIASSCIAAAHAGYLYYDAKCSDTGIMANDELVSANSYTSCSSTATLSALSGFSSFLWQGPAGSGISGATSSSVTTTTPGDYTLTATTGTVVSTQTINLVINTLSPPVIIGTNTVCLGNSVSLQAIGNGISSYTWSTGANSSTVSVSPAAATTVNYSVVTTNSLGCIVPSFFNVMAFAPPVVSTSATTLNACSNQTVGLSAGPSFASSYQWDTGAASASIVVTPSVNTVYNVTVTSLDGCIGMGSIGINVFPTPTVQLTVSSPTLCTGETVSMTANSSPGVNYQWSHGPNTQSTTVIPGVSGIYNVTVTSNVGCRQVATQSLTVYPVPQLQVNISPSLCLGQSASLSASGTNINTYQWSTGATTASTSATPTQNSVYSITVTSNMGCVTSGSGPVLVKPLPQLQFTIPSQSICLGESVQIYASGSALISYQWSNGQSTFSMTAAPLVDAVYSLTVASANGCSTNSTVAVSVFACTGLIENNIQTNGLLVFPNPAHDSFTIKANGREQGYLVNALGQLIQKFILVEENNFSQSFNNLAAGVYFARTPAQAIKVIVN